jgi:uncharacterized protein YjbI with pentapeptide repeats
VAKPARPATPVAPEEDSPVVSDRFGGQVHLGASVVDLTFRDSDLANLDARRSTATRVLAHRCRATGAMLMGTRLRDVVARDCRADLATFAQATLERVVFEDCVLRDASFAGTRLHSVSFVDCDLHGADFTGARCSRVELRGCRLEGLLGIEGLRGAKLGWSDLLDNATVLAAALGLGVIDEDAP